ncbi:type II toxin-antitoxin system VapC family toxin [Treponema primitia]|uniref:type II toxin-antitoxin system VapC family toxin n=1 Tax=Treponema primitia TaxID=88058 RepID=UPI0002555671|nr:PIN domain-containing protein [Treponema primitia]
MLNTILIDAGPLIALFDKDDTYHEPVINFLRGKNYRFISTLAVLTEVCYMLDFSIKAQMDFFEWVNRHGLILHEIPQEDLLQVSSLINQYHDLPMDFADATLVIAAEKRGIRSIISIDSDFDIYRLPGKRMIKNVFTQE